jgi:primosomal protein N' (replication factor Y) (superfamily II helicase)
LNQVAQNPFVTVLVDCPGAQGLFTYGVPPNMVVQLGDVVSVSFGAQQVCGIAIAHTQDLPGDLTLVQVKPVQAVVSSGFFPLGYWALLEQVADYYHTPLIQVVRTALPPGLLTRSQRRVRLKCDPSVLPPPTLSAPAQKLLKFLQNSKTKDYSWVFLQQQVKGLAKVLQELSRWDLVEIYLEPPRSVKPKQQQAVTLITTEITTEITTGAEKLTPRQREILTLLSRRGGELWMTELLQIAHTSSSTLKTLERHGCVTIAPQEILRSETITKVGSDQPKVLNPQQAEAVAEIQGAIGQNMEFLLHGVTGSGKTEVYLQAMAPVLARGQSVLVLVPEIGLTPQLTDRFRARFGNQVAVYHSGLSEGERYDTWRRMLGGGQVVIGTRSAVFSPLPNLGLIILDEEHDSSFKQDQPQPCYHARLVARWRSHLVSCPLVLGSATPSMESWARDCRVLSLSDRVEGRPMPKIEVVDMRAELKSGCKSILSQTLQEALHELKRKQQQGILFIHRRGHSTHVSCRSCGYVMDCPHCDVSLAYHQTHANAIPLLRCHYCGHSQTQPRICPECDSPYFKQFGSGTQRVTQELTSLLPQLRLLRYDSDTTRTKGAYRSLLNQFASGDADLLVGTQMLTKGIDLPQVTLVGIVSADGVLNLQDFRASERAYQTLVQVAGRSGRGKDPGRVILQTYQPEHPVVQAVVAQNYAQFMDGELQIRKLGQYPPINPLVLLRLSSADALAVQQAAKHLATWLHRYFKQQTRQNIELLGPNPAVVARVARRYRWQILLKLSGLDFKNPNFKNPNFKNSDAADQIDMPDLQEMRTICGNQVALSVDVDPMNLI